MSEARITPDTDEPGHGDAAVESNMKQKAGREIRVQHPTIFSPSRSLIKLTSYPNLHAHVRLQCQAV